MLDSYTVNNASQSINFVEVFVFRFDVVGFVMLGFDEYKFIVCPQ